jgi:cobaltochelatase CobN
MTPDLVKDSDWNQIYDVYVADKYNMGLDEYFKDNPYQYQSMTARMLETARKGYWDASDEVIQSLVKEYVESVVASGVTCCHHTCGNPLLDNYVRGVMTTTGVVDVSTAEEYERLVQEATKRESTPVTEESTTRKSSSSTGTDLKVVDSGSGSTNQTMMSESGAGMDTNTPAQDAAMSTPDNYVEGYEMTRESVAQPDNSGPSFSGSDIIASVLVLAGVGAIYMGFVRRKKF